MEPTQQTGERPSHELDEIAAHLMQAGIECWKDMKTVRVAFRDKTEAEVRIAPNLAVESNFDAGFAQLGVLRDLDELRMFGRMMGRYAPTIDRLNVEQVWAKLRIRIPIEADAPGRQDEVIAEARAAAETTEPPPTPPSPIASTGPHEDPMKCECLTWAYAADGMKESIAAQRNGKPQHHPDCEMGKRGTEPPPLEAADPLRAAVGVTCEILEGMENNPGVPMEPGYLSKLAKKLAAAYREKHSFWLAYANEITAQAKITLDELREAQASLVRQKSSRNAFRSALRKALPGYEVKESLDAVLYLTECRDVLERMNAERAAEIERLKLQVSALTMETVAQKQMIANRESVLLGLASALAQSDYLDRNGAASASYPDVVKALNRMLVDNATLPALRELTQRLDANGWHEVIDLYQRETARTVNPEQSKRDNLANFGMGVTGEAGELAEVLKKHLFHEQPLDLDRLIKEGGDVLWYVARIFGSLDVKLSEVAKRNIEKLRERYPNGFTPKDSAARPDEQKAEA